MRRVRTAKTTFRFKRYSTIWTMYYNLEDRQENQERQRPSIIGFIDIIRQIIKIGQVFFLKSEYPKGKSSLLHTFEADT